MVINISFDPNRRTYSPVGTVAYDVVSLIYWKQTISPSGDRWTQLNSEEVIALSGSAYSIIQDEGINLPQRAVIDFVGGGVVATDTGSKTQVRVSGMNILTYAGL